MTSFRHSITLISVLPIVACGSSPGTPDAGGDAGADVSPDAGCTPVGSKVWDTQPTQLGTDATITSMFPRVGVDAANNTIVVWEQATVASSTQWTVWASVRPAATGIWSAAKQIDGTGTTGIPAEPLPALAVSANGSAVVAYQTGLPANGLPQATNVSYVFYTSAGWGTPAAFFAPVVGNNTTGNETPQVAIDSKGNAIAVFAQDMGSNDSTSPGFDLEIYAARAPAGQAFGTATLLSSYVSFGTAARPYVAMNDAGNAVAAFQVNPPNAPIRVAASTFNGTTWGAAGYIDQGPSQSNLGIYPHVAMDASGNALVAWSQKTGANIPVFSARYSGGSWATAVQLDANLGTNLNADSVGIKMDSNGTATAVWSNTSNDTSHPNSIIAARNTAGTWAPAIPIDTTKPGGNRNPELAVDDVGDVMVVWDDQGSIWAALYTAATSAWKPEVHLDSQDSSAGYADVAFMHGCPSAVAVWQNNPGSQQTGSYALLYH